MKQQTTFNFWKTNCAILTMFLGIVSVNSMQAQLYTNGPISTGATHVATSTAAPAGYTWSELQTPSGTLGFSSFYNTAMSNDFAIADEFVVPAGQTWNLTNLNVYGYQTGYAGATIPADAMRVRIWNGDPSLGTSTVVYGDMTTNVLNAAGSGEEFVYRVFNTTGTTRKIWRFNANVSTSLAAGTYWVEFQIHATNDGSLFFPPVTILGTQSDTNWNAKQRNAAAWAGLIDTGSSFNKAIAFQIIGSSVLSVESNTLSSSFTMYPMPVKNNCNFKWNGVAKTSPESLIIYDYKGTEVLNQKVYSNTSDFIVNLSNLQTGMYFVKIYDIEGKTIYTNKLVKE